MATLRNWLRRLIDEPQDASLDRMMRLRQQPVSVHEPSDNVREQHYPNLGIEAPPIR